MIISSTITSTIIVIAANILMGAIKTRRDIGIMEKKLETAI